MKHYIGLFSGHKGLILALTAMLISPFAFGADTTSSIDTGDTAWLIMATILVLMMSIPGIALFYGGLVRAKNVLSIVMQTLLIVAAVSLLWVAFGYSWAFGTGYEGSAAYQIIGGWDKAFLRDITVYSAWGTIPEFTWVMFQCMFALITPALILGAFAERIKFKGFMVFILLWVTLAYFPMAHWVWGGGFLQQMDAIDFAGGTVVHINAGMSALVMAIMIGKREDWKLGRPITPHSIMLVFLGTCFLWLGWFGFNAGSGLAANGLDANAFVVTHVAAAAAALTWLTLDWLIHKKPTTVGTCTGAVAGLVAITPAAGTVDVLGAFAIGIITPIICFFIVAVVKPHFKYDDALDAFGVHGIGGIVGSVLTGIFATQAVDGVHNGALYGDLHQLGVQCVATLFTMAFSVIVTFILFYVVDKSVGIRVDKRVEDEGLDIYEHGESCYNR